MPMDSTAEMEQHVLMGKASDIGLAKTRDVKQSQKMAYITLCPTKIDAAET